MGFPPLLSRLQTDCRLIVHSPKFIPIGIGISPQTAEEIVNGQTDKQKDKSQL